MKFSASNLVKAIGGLSKEQWYEYINPRTNTRVRVHSVTFPEGPIVIERYNPKTGKKKKVTISTNMLWRIANAFQPDTPIQFDRVLGASYNSRSALEALIAHTPEFFWCTPGRIEVVADSQKVKKGHKHLIWRPAFPHRKGVLEEFQTDIIVSELPNVNAVYEALEIPSEINNIEVSRHSTRLIRIKP